MDDLHIEELRSLAASLREDGASRDEIRHMLGKVARKSGLNESDVALAESPEPSLPRPSIGVRASDVKTRPIEWLWQHYFPKAKVTIIDGDPEKGKSLITTDIAARVSTGRAFPDGTPCTLGSAIIANLDDAMDDTIVPRLRAANADLGRIVLLETIADSPIKKADGTPFSKHTVTLPKDILAIGKLIRDQNASLLVIDPFLSFLSEGTDSHKVQSIAKVMLELKELAEKTGATIIIVRHLTKGSPNITAIYRGMGSIGIVGTARQGFLVERHPANPDIFVMARTKGNLTKNKLSWSYTIVENDEKVPCIRWGQQISMSADELVAGQGEEISVKEFTRSKAQVLTAIIECKDRVQNGFLVEKVILERLNRGRPSSEQITAQHLGRTLKYIGFEITASSGNGSKALRWDEQKMTDLCQRFGVQ